MSSGRAGLLVAVLASGATGVVGVVGCNAILDIDDHGLATTNADVDGGQTNSSGPPGCFRGTPSTDEDFLNQCTGAQYLKFDNCARLGLCQGEIPTLVDPVASGTGGTTGVGTLTPPSVSCYDANARNKLILMQGSTNFGPFIQSMAPLIAKNGYVIVWQPTSSCRGAGAGGFDTRPGRMLMTNPTTPGQSYAAFYDQNGQATPCLLGNSPTSPDGASELTDIGESDVFARGCPLPAGEPEWVPGSAAYPDIGHYLGPIQAMVFVAPGLSSQRAISAEAARMVFGMGGAQGVASPWTDPRRMYVRGATTGTNIILSHAIDVANDRWWGIDTQTAAAMQTAILTTSASDAEATIGTLSSDYADKLKDTLHILFFQARGQLAGFLPDSSPNAFDKQNVRDGHYSPWGPIHLYTRLVGGQASAQAAAFIVPFTIPNQALIDATIAAGDVPICAMHVSRDQEMGPIKAFTPPGFSCDCYFDFKVSNGNHCTPCGGPADCPPSFPACNLGYCEED
ncbi:MAG TPA: hypothetical protein VFH68_02045 [Polyangia bacterium]|nr:hypothetical protein [Polyangia bacterium]